MIIGTRVSKIAKEQRDILSLFYAVNMSDRGNIFRRVTTIDFLSVHVNISNLRTFADKILNISALAVQEIFHSVVT